MTLDPLSLLNHAGATRPALIDFALGESDAKLAIDWMPRIHRSEERGMRFGNESARCNQHGVNGTRTPKLNANGLIKTIDARASCAKIIC